MHKQAPLSRPPAMFRSSSPLPLVANPPRYCSAARRVPTPSHAKHSTHPTPAHKCTAAPPLPASFPSLPWARLPPPPPPTRMCAHWRRAHRGLTGSCDKAGTAASYTYCTGHPCKLRGGQEKHPGSRRVRGAGSPLQGLRGTRCTERPDFSTIYPGEG
ncbi:hypothetical protein CALCODRAFT_364830 [Calocera cornea HHB12733]|uniref:Uncharacterized protein n=1 Tax=Calocera cornea HHB12733 TaxID=1353952 RepID=A0A165J8Y0_9BASI|nr:hypothetical protein CALCODRAFT_364830 [Calocera cornea HHB12733]